MCSRLFPTSFSISVSVSGYMWRSLIHLDLGFLQGDKIGSICILPKDNCQLKSTICWKGCLLKPYISLTWEALPVPHKYRGGCSQTSIGLITLRKIRQAHSTKVKRILSITLSITLLKHYQLFGSISFLNCLNWSPMQNYWTWVMNYLNHHDYIFLCNVNGCSDLVTWWE
jgi:hypothetical protein